MKHSKLILCGVACFASACLVGTSCSKQSSQKDQAQTESSTVSTENTETPATSIEKTKKSKSAIEEYGGVTAIVEVSMPEILGALAGDNSTTPRFKAAMDEARYQQRIGSQETFFDLFCAAYTEDGSTLASLFRAQLSDRIELDTPDDQVMAIVRAEINSAAENSFDVLRTRIDRFGIKQPNIKKAGNGRLYMELPGVKDQERIKKLLGSSANLQFWETYTLDEIGSYEKLQPLYGLFVEFGDPYSSVIGTANVADTVKINETLKLIAGDLPRNARFAWEVKPVDETGQYFRLIALKAERRGCPALEGDVITDARADNNEFTGRAEVLIKMNSNGARKWAEITQNNIGRAIAIVLDGYVYSFPVVMDVITGGSSQIAGNLTKEEAADLANILKCGKMPAPLRVVYMEVIEPQQ